jgi:acetyl esterase/lipase
MPSLKYKLFEGLLLLTGQRNRIFNDLEKPSIRSVGPKKKYKDRFVKTEFQGEPVLTVHPKSGPSQKRYVHYHGGAYVYRLMDIHYPTITELADESGVTIILPDYPIYPNSAQQMHDWSYAHLEALIAAYGLENIAIGGCSAGGNLAMALLQMRKKAGLENPKNTILWSPWVDLTMAEYAVAHNPKEALLTVKGIVAAGQRFTKGRDPKDPLLSPVFADMNGLSDFHIFTGQKDLLYPDIARFAEKAKEAGVLKSYVVEPNLGHYWMFYPTKERHETIAETAGLLSA